MPPVQPQPKTTSPSGGLSALLEHSQSTAPAPAPAPAPAATAQPRGGLTSLLTASPKGPDRQFLPSPGSQPQPSLFSKVGNAYSDVGTALLTPTKPQGFFKNLSDSFKSATDVFDQQVDNWGKPGVLNKIGAVGETMMQPINLAFAPISAALNSAAGLPVAGPVADSLNRVFGAISAGGSDTAKLAVDHLPISEEHKAAIRPLVMDLGALAAQIAAGEAAGHTMAAFKNKASLLVTKTQEVIDHPVTQKIAEQEMPKPKLADTSKVFSKSLAKHPNLAEDVKTMNPAQMHPALREDIRASNQKHGPDATQVALTEQLGMTDVQAQHYVREAKTPQNLAEHEAVMDKHADKLKPTEETAPSVASYINANNEKVFTRLSPDEFGALKDEVKNIPQAAEGHSQIHLDPDNPRLTEVAREVSRDEFVAGHPQAKEMFDKTKPISEMSIKELKTEAAKVEPLKTKPGESKVGKSVEAKAIEAKITKGFDKTAGYDVKPFKEAAEKTADLINSGIDNARAVVRGDAPRPEGVTSGSLIAGVEEYAKLHPQEAGDILSELANSSIASETSTHAQELGSLRMRELDSATARLKQIKDALIKKAGGKKVAASKSKIVRETGEAMKKVNLPKEELSWQKFLDGITC